MRSAQADRRADAVSILQVEIACSQCCFRIVRGRKVEANLTRDRALLATAQQLPGLQIELIAIRCVQRHRHHQSFELKSGVGVETPLCKVADVVGGKAKFEQWRGCRAGEYEATYSQQSRSSVPVCA